MKIEKIILDEVSFLQFKMPDYILGVIKSEVEEMISNKFNGSMPYNASLAGSIEHEYVLFKSAEALKDFFSHDRFSFNGKRLRLSYKKTNIPGQVNPALWVNFQKKYEFNPIHNHDGDVSFVLWLKIPYNLEDERAQPHSRSGTSPSGPAFLFLYPPAFSTYNWPVDYYRIDVDKTYEGTCILFRSGLQHMVTPFYTSDDYRISVSGNFNLE